MTKEEAINVIISTGCDTNKISDGYHTFGELYEHRITLFIALCRELMNNPSYQDGQKSEVWRSHKHSDGSSFEGWFLLGIGKERGDQITYHMPIDKWDQCAFAYTYDKAPDFDGHSSSDVLNRLNML